MPTCVPPKQKQLTTAQANDSRLTTRCMWIVEVINGRLKTLFRANDKIHHNTSLPHKIDDSRISASLINKYFPNFGTNKYDSTIANTMKSKLNTTNRLENILADHNIDKKRTFQKMAPDSIPDFPKLSLDSICNNITLGPYQLKQSVIY